MTDLLLSVMLALASTAVPAAPPPVKGTLCISAKKAVVTEGRCTATVGTAFAVAKAADERLFVWTSADGSSVAAGVVPANAEKLVLDEAAPSRVKLSIRATASRRWPAETRIGLSGAEGWRWTIEGKQVEKLAELRVVPGKYGLMVAAEHHQRLLRRFQAAQEPVALGELQLAAVPQIRGRVVDPRQKPIAGAAVTLVNHQGQNPCATTELDGSFQCDLAGTSLLVAAGGFGTREVALGNTLADKDLGIVVLQQGVGLTVKVRRPEGDRQPVSVALYHDDPQQYEHASIGSVSLAAGEEVALFNDLAPGKYFVLLSGKGPLEKLIVPAEIGDQQAEVEARIEPFRVEGSVLLGEEPLRDAKLNVSDPHHLFRSEVPLDSDARFVQTMWTHGTVTGGVGRPDFGMPEWVQSPELGADPSSWPIRIRRREISGHVLDAQSKQPLGDTRIRVRTDVREARPGGGFSQARAYFEVKADSFGAFTMLATKDGTYQLSVEDPEYVPSPVEVQLGPDEGSRNVDLMLSRGVSQLIRARWPDGAAVALGSVLEGVAADGHNPEHMYVLRNGEASIAGAPGTTRTFFLLPREGSIAVIHLVMPASKAEMKPVDVVVPAPAASLRVRRVDGSGNPVKSGYAVMRYNGEFIPYAMEARAFGAVLPGSVADGELYFSRMPAGTYELFLLRNSVEEGAAAAGGVKPAATVGLSAGEQTVTVEVPAAAAQP